MSLAFYRKYRPKTLEDLLGQELVSTILQNTAKEGKIAHAYLFYGSRGSGKTTAARLLAKLANCETRVVKSDFRARGEPCNKCRACQEIDEGRAIDVVEIDGASNRGIDEIRNLKEGIRLSPISSPYKVFIIDEVHMLTGAAFNALLKTLEEPPAHAIFILATTEFEKLPATIVSRTQRFAFKRLTREIIAKKLRAICKEEKLKFEDEALDLIAVAAEGSLRDAESLLDQVASSANEITTKAVESVIGSVGFKKLAEITELLVTKDLPKSLEYINKLNGSGVNLGHFMKDLIHYIRRVLSLKMNPELKNMFSSELTSHDLERMIDIGTKTDVVFLISLIKSFIRGYSEMRYSPFQIIPIEVAVIENLKQN